MHAVALVPELAGKAGGFARGVGRVVGGGDQHLGAEFGHVGEGVADHDAGGQRAAFAFEPFGVTD